jgi:hypothetical protein
VSPTHSPLSNFKGARPAIDPGSMGWSRRYCLQFPNRAGKFLPEWLADGRFSDFRPNIVMDQVSRWLERPPPSSESARDP